MNLSVLQQFIVRACSDQKGKISRVVFERYYQKRKSPPSKKEIANRITKSIDRLITKNVLVGYGRKTSHKLFIESVALTPQGKKIARGLRNRQRPLPFK